MVLDWDVQPDDARLVKAEKHYHDGKVNQIEVVVQFLAAGEVIRTVTQMINPGWIKDNFPALTAEERVAKFKAFGDQLPEPTQQKLDAISAQIPDAAWKAMWK